MAHRKIIVEPSEEQGWLIAMYDDGHIFQFRTPKHVIDWVRKHDRIAANIGRSTATLIEWRDMPEGFKPPD